MGRGKVSHSCPLRTRLYGGLPSGGGFGSYTEFEIGAQRVAEAAHCILGSLGRDVSGAGTWDVVVRAERAHLKEELGIIERVAKEYSKPAYRKRLTDFEDYLPQYREEAKSYAERSVNSILKAAPKLIQTAKARAQDLLRQKDIPLPIANTAASAYLVVKALAEAMRDAVKTWPEHVGDPYSDRRFLSAVAKLRQYTRELLATPPEVLNVPRKSDAIKVAIVKKHPERGVYCLFDSEGEKALDCFDNRYKDEKPPKSTVQKAERRIQYFKHKNAEIAHRYLARKYERPRYDTGRLTQMLAEDFPLEVPEMRFQRAMAKFARSIGGRYQNGTIQLPHAPKELTVLYQKWYDRDGPHVAFSVFPTREGNRSKMFRSFEGPVKGSRRLFQKFLTWLGIIGSAIQQHAYGRSDLAQKLRPSRARVASHWEGLLYSPEVRTEIMRPSAQKVANAYVQKKSSEADEALLKWLVKRRKKSKGIVQMNMVEKAFEMLDGWSIASTTTYVLLNGTYDEQRWFLAKLAPELGAQRVGHALRKKEPIEFLFTSKDAADKGLKKFKRLVELGTSASAKAPSGKAHPFRLYAGGKPKLTLDQHGSWVMTLPRMWLGVPGWHIQSAKGKSIDLPSPISSRGKLPDPNRLEKFNKFWTWTYKNGLAESAKEALDSLDPSDVEMAAAPKSKQKKLKQRRIMLPEVRKLLTDLTQKQYQEYINTLTDAHIDALDRAINAQNEALNEGKSFSMYRWLRENMPFFARYINRATEPEEKNRHSGPQKRTDNYRDIAKATAKEMADSIRNSFIGKNGAKLSLIVKGKGNLKDAKVLKMNRGDDYGGEILFTFKDGSSFVVKNKTVFKWSPLGKPFQQYPTTFHKVKLPNGETMRSPSEKRMVEVFATA